MDLLHALQKTLSLALAKMARMQDWFDRLESVFIVYHDLALQERFVKG